jgi:hypothetical protein
MIVERSLSEKARRYHDILPKLSRPQSGYYQGFISAPMH